MRRSLGCTNCPFVVFLFFCFLRQIEQYGGFTEEMTSKISIPVIVKVLFTEEMECNVLIMGGPFLTQETVYPVPVALAGGTIDRTGEGNTILRGSRRQAGH